jgi:lipoprotein-releasing system permease protein
VGLLLVVLGAAGVALAVAQDETRYAPPLAVVALWGAVHLVVGAASRRTPGARDDVRAVRLGWPAWGLPLATVVHTAVTVSLHFQRELLPAPVFAVWGWASFGASAVFLVMVAVATLARVRACAAETAGVVRTTVGALGSLTLLAGQLAFGTVVGVVGGAGSRYELDLAFALPDRSPLQTWLETIDTLAYGQGLGPVLYASFVVMGLAVLAQLASVVAAFWLIPDRVRAGFWLVVDGLATLLFVGALWTLPFVPEDDDEDVTLPAVALGITTLFVSRALFRLIPRLLDSLERSGFEVQVAARMLRAKKSGFLTAIGLLSILAVSFSSCTLATTLSVMGGFRADLQQKILGNHAHVVVDRAYGTFEGWADALEAVRAAPSVSGASPYVAGEVMLTSAIEAPGGAELRGIDPATIGDATDLPRNMRFGRLEYLVHPERMLDLPPAAMSGSLLAPPVPAAEPTPDPGAPVAPAEPGSVMALAERPMRDEQAPSSGLVGEIDRVLEGLPESDARPRPAGAPPSDERQRELQREIEEILGLGPEGLDPGGLADAGAPSDALPLDTHELREPSRPEPMRDVLPGLVVGQELARSLRLHVGDEVTVVSPNGDLGPTGPVPRTRAFRIAGIFYTGMFEYDMQMAYTDLETAQAFLRAGEGVTGIEARVHDWSRADEAADEVRRAVGREDLRVRSWREVNRNLFGALELEKLAMFITLGIAILVASFCIFAALVLMVQEKGREIGILKAMGAEDGAIVRVFLFQGLLIGLFGATSGLGLGYLVCFAAEHFKFIRMNPEVYYIDRLPVNVDPVEFALVGVAAVVVCVLATIYPAVLGSRLRPVDALRQT